MKHFLILFLILTPTLLFSQRIIKERSNAVDAKIEPTFEFTYPPVLYVNMEFKDETGDGVINANENAKLILEFFNRGSGPAQGLNITFKSNRRDPAFTISDAIYIPFIAPNSSHKVTIPMEAGFNVESLEHHIEINVTEHFGYDMDPATLIVNTLEYQEPEIVFSGMEIFDSGQGTVSIVTDGQLQAGEMVKAKIVVQNIGNNIARNVRYQIDVNDSNIYLRGTEGNLGDLAIGEVKEFWTTISPNRRVDHDGFLPLFLNIEVENERGSLKKQQLPLALNSSPPSAETFTVKANIERIREQVARFEYNSDKYTSNISALNVDAVPVGSSVREDAVAIVIGVENYQNIAPAPYAARDAELMARYFQNTLGIKNVITHINEDASGFFFINIFDAQTGRLQRMINRGKTEVFIYYSGHGMPEKDGKDVFLFPHDGRLEMLEVMGYSLNKLYDNLNELGAKSVTVFLDACFSGTSRASQNFIAENISQTRGIVLQPLTVQPWQTNENFRVFSSSQGQQTSLAFDASQTGLYTYFLALGLQGAADADGDNKITSRELHEYLKTNVSDQSRRIRGEQTPQFFGDGDYVIVEF